MTWRAAFRTARNAAMRFWASSFFGEFVGVDGFVFQEDIQFAAEECAEVAVNEVVGGVLADEAGGVDGESGFFFLDGMGREEGWREGGICRL